MRTKTTELIGELREISSQQVARCDADIVAEAADRLEAFEIALVQIRDEINVCETSRTDYAQGYSMAHARMTGMAKQALGGE